MPNRNYYPLPSAASGGAFGITNMWDSALLASYAPIYKSTGSPGGLLTLQFIGLVQGGTPPYTYLWHTGSQISISDVNIAGPIFSAAGGSPTGYKVKQDTFALHVTDSSGTPLTDTKYVQFVFSFGGFPP